MSYMTVDEIHERIKETMGNRTAPSIDTKILQAMNQAYLQVVLRHMDVLSVDFEVTPPFYFETAVFTGTASNSIGEDFVRLDSGISAVPDHVGQLLRFSGESELYRITKIDSLDIPPRLYTSPVFRSAHSAADCAVIHQRFPLPDGTDAFKIDLGLVTSSEENNYPDIFYLIDVRDVETRRRIRQADVRRFDRTLPVIGDPAWYYRSAKNIWLHPIPDVENIKYQIRYCRRPREKILGASVPPNDQFFPLPNEWERVLMFEAMSYLAAEFQEHERADYFAKAGREIASEIIAKRRQEMEDAEPRFRPRFGYVNTGRESW